MTLYARNHSGLAAFGIHYRNYSVEISIFLLLMQEQFDNTTTMECLAIVHPSFACHLEVSKP